MSQISDYTDDPSLMSSDFKQNFDLVSPEEIQYYSDSLFHDFEELNRQSFIFGLPVPKRVNDLRKWMEENLHPQLQLTEQEPSFFHDILVIRKVTKGNGSSKVFLRRRRECGPSEAIDNDLVVVSSHCSSRFESLQAMKQVQLLAVMEYTSLAVLARRTRKNTIGSVALHNEKRKSFSVFMPTLRLSPLPPITRNLNGKCFWGCWL
jgi:hypothetical protein